jgi:hypothetical protein
MRIARLFVVVAAICFAVVGPVHAQGGTSCSGPGEPSFTCGFVVVTVQVGSDVETVLAACQPVGTVSDVSGRDFLISVPVGHEIALRDCYGAVPGVSQANLLYAGGLTPDSAMRTSSGLGLAAVGVALLSVAILKFASLSVARSRKA